MLATAAEGHAFLTNATHSPFEAACPAFVSPEASEFDKIQSQSSAAASAAAAATSRRRSFMDEPRGPLRRRRDRGLSAVSPRRRCDCGTNREVPCGAAATPCRLGRLNARRARAAHC